MRGRAPPLTSRQTPLYARILKCIGPSPFSPTSDCLSPTSTLHRPSCAFFPHFGPRLHACGQTGFSSESCGCISPAVTFGRRRRSAARRPPPPTPPPPPLGHAPHHSSGSAPVPSACRDRRAPTPKPKCRPPPTTATQNAEGRRPLWAGSSGRPAAVASRSLTNKLSRCWSTQSSVPSKPISVLPLVVSSNETSQDSLSARNLCTAVPLCDRLHLRPSGGDLCTTTRCPALSPPSRWSIFFSCTGSA